ncbi:MAG TPA: hypothetical protein VG755_20930 [Nannocystaceae bacterium]|nr:hypothetical protein [Nannocystaceae bacterium]
MDATKAELESRIRTKRARLDDKLARLGARFEEAKHTSKLVGMITAGVVVAMALVGATAILVRGIVARRRRPRGIVVFPR